MDGLIFCINGLTLVSTVTILFQMHYVRDQCIKIDEYFFRHKTYKWKLHLFHQTIKNGDYTIFYQVICAFLTVMQQVFALCYLGDMATSKCATTNEDVYHTNWYKYPVKMQKFIILIMMRSQKQFVFKGFSLLQCSLPAFKEVGCYCSNECFEFIR